MLLMTIHLFQFRSARVVLSLFVVLVLVCYFPKVTCDPFCALLACFEGVQVETRSEIDIFVFLNGCRGGLIDHVRQATRPLVLYWQRHLHKRLYATGILASTSFYWPTGFMWSLR